MIRSPLTRLLTGLLLVSSFGLAACETQAAKLGAETLPVKDARGRDITTEIWYPANDAATETPFAARPFFQPIALARGASYCCADRRPLVVISHGVFGNRFSQAWLAGALVARGYIVATVTHPNTTADDITPAGIYRLWDRAQDVSALLDHVLADPTWSARIDPQHIGFVGHSFGGGTGVLLAGGTHDADALIRFCKSPAAAKDTYCPFLSKLDPQNLDLRPAKASYQDARIRAFYIMASAPAQGFAIDTLHGIRVPFAVETAEKDEILDNALNSQLFAREIPGAAPVGRAVGHFAYVPVCIAGSVPPQAATICTDPPAVARETAHPLVADAVIQFLKKHL
jgi:predicted dienelactone hydrolase